MTVLGASAVLALLHDEAGADEVGAVLPAATLGSSDLAEVIGQLVDAEVDVVQLRELLAAAGVTIEPLLEATQSSPAPALAPARPGPLAGRRLLSRPRHPQRPGGGADR